MTAPSTPRALERATCSGVTKTGKPCGAHPVTGTNYCMGHTDRETQKSVGFGGPQPNAGRPRIPKPSELAMELVEARVEELVGKMLDRAFNAERTLVSPAKGILGTEPDEAIRQRAAEFLLPYRWGKPTSRTEITGAGGGPVSIAHLVMSLNDVEVHGGDDGRT